MYLVCVSWVDVKLYVTSVDVFEVEFGFRVGLCLSGVDGAIAGWVVCSY